MDLPSKLGSQTWQTRWDRFCSFVLSYLTYPVRKRPIDKVWGAKVGPINKTTETWLAKPCFSGLSLQASLISQLEVTPPDHAACTPKLLTLLMSSRWISSIGFLWRALLLNLYLHDWTSTCELGPMHKVTKLKSNCPTRQYCSNITLIPLLLCLFLM